MDEKKDDEDCHIFSYISLGFGMSDNVCVPW